jgi:hypothetical protein
MQPESGKEIVEKPNDRMSNPEAQKRAVCRR